MAVVPVEFVPVEPVPAEGVPVSGDVVGVGVGDEDGSEISRGQAQFSQSSADPAARDAGVHQKVRVPAGEDQRVAGRAAGQCM